ncbi:MAG: hypothetical protein PHC68_00465 [Syntrophorhabdaceae bacterium]|nr:hypothetical protein [Syntrophorhabdaceae bacterium]
MITKIKGAQEKLQKAKWHLSHAKGELSQIEKKMRATNREIHFTEEAQTLIKKVAIETQEQLRYHLSELVSTAMATILPEDIAYTFQIKFLDRRGAVECEFSLKRGEAERGVFSAGGGVVDIVATALRFSVLMLSKNRRVIILDEPFRNLSRNWHPLASEFIKEVSTELGIQVILVTHSNELIEASESVIEVSSDGTQSWIGG